MRMSFKEMVLSCLENTLYCKMFATIVAIISCLVYKYMHRVYFPDMFSFHYITLTLCALFWLFGKDKNWFETVEED